MKVDVSMTADKDQFSVSSWWANTPAFVVEALQKQLEAATAIWPELAVYRVAKGRDRKAAGVAGGRARAAAMSPEQRAEIASKAAKARWAG